MTDLNGRKPDNVIDMTGRKRTNKASTLDQRKPIRKKVKKTSTKGKASFWQYIQLIMVFALIAYLMQRCDI